MPNPFRLFNHLHSKGVDKLLESKALEVFSRSLSSSHFPHDTQRAQLRADTLSHISPAIPNSLALQTQESESILIELDAKYKPRQPTSSN